MEKVSNDALTDFFLNVDISSILSAVNSLILPYASQILYLLFKKIVKTRRAIWFSITTQCEKPLHSQ